MRLALTQARKGLGRTSPNPAVGAIIVRNQQVLASGWHHCAGQPHAEIEALRNLADSERARGATIYVTLEPCSTHGRTPPCVEAIISHGFARVVVGAEDPNPRHAGRGFAELTKAGIELTTGVLNNECTRLNEGFNHWIVSARPFVIAKSAMSLDGRITRPVGEGQWLTSASSRRYGQRLRMQVGAIIIGAETLRQDNPRLTVRSARNVPAKRQPWRVVVSRSRKLPGDAHLFTDEWKDHTLVFSALETALIELGKREVTSVLLEGGGQLLGSAFERKLVDRVEFFYAPLFTSGRRPSIATTETLGVKLREISYQQIGSDLHLSALVERRLHKNPGIDP